MPGSDGRHPYADTIGMHRPLVLDSCAEFISGGFTEFNATVSDANWPATNRAKFMRIRNPRAFMPTHGYVAIGTNGADNWCVAVYKERFNGSIGTLVRVGTTGAIGGTTGIQFAFAPIVMDEPLDQGEYILALQITTTASSALERRPGEGIGYHTRQMGLAVGQPSGFPLPISFAGYGDPGVQSGLTIFGVTARLF
ncbi:MAG TPA: hypothetical protein VFH61_06500 [Thermoleophilia bacterium]|nr:hypothetical protein [Thermoleophilia bacterium]